VSSFRASSTVDTGRNLLWRLQIDSGLLLVVEMDPTAPEYRVIGGNVRGLTGHTGKIMKLAWNWDGTVLASASEDSTVRLWKFDHAAINAGTTAAPGLPPGSAGLPKEGSSRVLKAHTGPVDCIAWSPTDKHVLASSGADGILKLWDTRDTAGPSCRVDALLAVSNNAENIAFKPDGTTIAMGTRTDELVLIDVRGGRPTILGRNKFTMQLNEIAWTPSGLIFCMCTSKTPPLEEGYLVVVRANLPPASSAAAAGAATTVGTSSSSAASSAIVSTSSSATSVAGGTAAAVGTVTPVLQVLAHTMAGNTITFDRSYRFFATGGSDSIVSLWESSDVTCIRTFDRNESLIRNVSFSSDGSMLAAASDDKVMEIVSSPYQHGKCGYSTTIVLPFASIFQTNSITIFQIDFLFPCRRASPMAPVSEQSLSLTKQIK
jgi:THO complex subunit 3